jgi:hypothetical protein
MLYLCVPSLSHAPLCTGRFLQESVTAGTGLSCTLTVKASWWEKPCRCPMQPPFRSSLAPGRVDWGPAGTLSSLRVLAEVGRLQAFLKCPQKGDGLTETGMGRSHHHIRGSSLVFNSFSLQGQITSFFLSLKCPGPQIFMEQPKEKPSPHWRRISWARGRAIESDLPCRCAGLDALFCTLTHTGLSRKRPRIGSHN